MSAKKKNSGRQSNLFTFFQRTPKSEKSEEIITPLRNESCKNKTGDELDEDLENIPSIKVEECITPSNKNSPKINNGKNKSKPLLSPAVIKQQFKMKEEEQKEVPIILDDDSNSRENVEGFLSCSFTDSPSSPQLSLKRRRIILSSDEEDVDDNYLNKSKTERKMKKNENDDEIGNFDKNVLNNGKDKSDDKTAGEEKVEDDTPYDGDCHLINQKEDEENKSTKTCSFIESFSFSNKTDNEIDIITLEGKTILKTPKKNKISIGDENKVNEDHFPHLDFEFLKKPKDVQGKRPTDPEYDFRTLFVPPEFLKQQTPGHQQWWRLKSAHFDTLLFFKVGKFYELYHMDAVIAVENLSLAYMRGKYAHCGFPEAAYGRYAEQLVNKGYKVARIEQTETPEQLAERQKTPKKSLNCSSPRVEKEKVVRRELCRLTTLGTKTYGILDGNDSRESDVVVDSNPNYLLALTERKSDNQQNDGSSRFGVCFVDCSVGRFFLVEFDDDRFQSNLRTLFAHNLPSQLLYEKGAVSSSTINLLETMLSGVPKEILFPKRQFMTAEDTLNLLTEEQYFGSKVEQWPDIIRSLLMESSVPKPLKQHQLSISAFGAILWYLRQCLIDIDLISMRQFERYFLPSLVDETNDNLLPTSSSANWTGKHTILDGSSLLNLHILPSLSLNSNTSSSFSLFNTLNRCLTPSGKRLLRQWISTPSCDKEILLGRQSCIKWLMADERRPHLSKWLEILKKIPDLERLFQRIHTIGGKHRAVSKNGGGGHPDSRAQFFDNDKYNKRKIRDLLAVLDGLEELIRLKRMFLNANEMSGNSAPSMLVNCFGNNYSEMNEDLQFFKEAFDHESALQHGVIQPHTGVDEEYDLACNEFASCESHINDFLEKMKKRFKCSTIKFVGTGRNSYQLEIPEAYCTSLGKDFRLTSQRKGFKRYNTDELQQLLDQLSNAEGQRDLISTEVTRRVFADFDLRKNKWSSIVNGLSHLDCLISLSLYSQTSTKQMCFPEFCYESEEPFLSICKGYHPSLIDAIGIDYIPNDCQLGGKNSATLMLLTGANMGGKSTYMRQIATLVVMAQIGSMVPANSMKLTPVDRIFCRIGASDRLVAGQSTFYIELSETNIILRQATSHSLVLIDELGRGTSTYDGTAIAGATLKYISTNIRCRALFATHYHALCKFVDNNPNVKLGHMACMVENASLEDPTMEAITFLYTLAEGVCDKSYGFYTAKVAGIDVEIVRKAFAASKILEENRQKQQ